MEGGFQGFHVCANASKDLSLFDASIVPPRWQFDHQHTGLIGLGGIDNNDILPVLPFLPTASPWMFSGSQGGQW